MRARITMEVIYFVILYLIAFFSARDIREDDAILGVNRSQWSALFVMWIPSLVAFVK